MWFFMLIARLPWWFMYGISDVLYFFVTRVFKYRKSVVLFNLRMAFPEKSDAEIQKIAKGFYHNLCDVIVEMLKTAHLSRKEMQQHVVVEGDELMLDYMAKGQSVLVICNHLCNWEWLLLGQGAGDKYTMPIDAIYKPLRNQFFDRLILRIRTKFGGNMIPDKKVLREIAKTRNSGGRLMAIMSDQAPPPVGAYKTTFLGLPTNFFVGPGKLAKATNFPVFFESMTRIKRGKYRVSVKLVAEPPFESEEYILETYARWLEATIRECPEDWLWSHKRWKHTVPMP